MNQDRQAGGGDTQGKRPDKGQQTSKKQAGISPLSLALLGLTLGVYGVLFLLGDPKAGGALRSAGELFLQVLPVLAVVLLFMTAANLIPGRYIKTHLGKSSGLKGYLIAVLAGTFSHGPAYAWYPFLSDLQTKGVTNGKLAAFLYARAVKIPLLAAMVFYFGLPFTLLFSTLILVGALLLGKLFEWIDGDTLDHIAKDRT